jgi:hypothetical protein
MTISASLKPTLVSYKVEVVDVDDQEEVKYAPESCEQPKVSLYQSGVLIEN